MTGFFRADIQQEDLSCTVEIRSVNHRHLETKLYLPKTLQQFEEPLKKIVKQHLKRGKVDVNLTCSSLIGEQDFLEVSPSHLENLKILISSLEKELEAKIPISMTDILNMKGLLAYQPNELDKDSILLLFEKAVLQGVQGLISMREKEGILLEKDINEHLRKMGELINQVPNYNPILEEQYRTRIKNRLNSLNLDFDSNDPRIQQEIGMLLERADVTEEVERFKAHLSHINDLLRSEETVGRKLDFLLQEFNREANTICSKSGHSKITEIGVELKCEVEKVREQIQNIE